MSKFMFVTLIGFTVGTLAGFVYGGRVKDGAPDAVKTNYDGGIITVKVDAVQALKNGLPMWLK